MPLRDNLSNIIDWVSNASSDVFDWATGTPVVRGIGKGVELASRPSKAVAAYAGAPRGEGLEFAKKALTGEYKDTDWDWVLGEKFGMQPGLGRTLLGLTGDIVADPLNLVGGITTGAKVYPKLRKGVLEALKSGKVGREIVGKFSLFENLPEHLQVPAKLLTSEVSHQPHTVETRIKAIYRGAEKVAGRAPTEQEREAATRVLATGDWTLPADANQKVVKHIVDEGRKYLDELYDTEVGAGVMGQEKIKDYFPYLIRRKDADPEDVISRIKSQINPKNPHAQIRTSPTYDDFLRVAKNMGEEPITDVFEGLLQRGLKGSKSASMGKFVQKLAADEKFAKKLAEAPSGWKGISTAKYKGLPLEEKVKELAFEPEVAKYLDALAITQPYGASAELYDKVLQGLKTGLTTIRPGFHWSNLKGNFWNMALGGENTNALGAFAESPGAFVKGLGAYRKIKNNQPLEAINGLKGEEITAFLKKHGIVGGSIHTLRDIAGPQGKQRLAEILETGSQGLGKEYVDFWRQFGANMEDSSKIGHFLNRVKNNPQGLKGEDLLTDALFSTQKTLFDYSQLTDFEKKVMRRIFPFWTFSKKNLPLQVQGLIEKPYMTSALGHVQRAGKNWTEAVRPEQVLNEGDLPPYATEQAPIQIPNLYGDKPLTIDPYLPVNDLQKLNIFDLPGVLRNLGSSTVPWIKMPLEVGMNKQLYSERPIHDERIGYWDNPIKTPLGNIPGKDVLKYVLSNLPMGQMAGALVDEAEDPEVILQAVKNLATEGKVPLPIFNFFTGAYMREQDPAKLLKAKQFRNRDEVARRKAIMKLNQP